MSTREPYSEEAECGVLGAMLIKPELIDILSADLVTKDFFFADNRAVFTAIMALKAKGSSVDFLTVADEIVTMHDGTNAIAYTAAIHKNTPSAANAKEYARIVLERSMDRKFAVAAHNIHELSTSTMDASDKVAQAQAEVAALNTETQSPDTVTAGEIMHAHAAEMERREALDGAMDGLSTGLGILDRKWGGMKPGQLILIAGRPKMGKTTLAMNIASHNALQGKKVLVVSLEMSNTQLMDRMVSSEGGIPLDYVKSGAALREYPSQYNDVMGRLATSGLRLSTRKGLSISRIRSMARRMKMLEGLDLLEIDHVGLVDGESRGENATQRISEITRQAKLMATELGIPVILLSQLNRELEKRPDKRPICADLRDSGSLEQDADIISFVYRDEVYHPGTEDRGIAEIITAAARDFEPGTVRTQYKGKYSKFNDLIGAAANKPDRPYSTSSLLD